MCTTDAYTELKSAAFPRAKLLGQEVVYQFVTDVDDLKATSFLDARSSEIVITTLFFTPQPAEYPDIATLLQISFTRNQFGAVMGKPETFSVSQTADSWYLLCGFAIFGSVVYLGSSVYSAKVILRSGLPWWQPRLRQFDVVLSVCSIVYLIALLLTDVLPPLCFDPETGLFAEAFAKKSEAAFVEMFSDFSSYAMTLQSTVQLGAMLIYALFVRACIFGTLHPRVALFIQTVQGVLSDMMHFALTFGVLFVALALIGHLFMGQYRADFADIPITLQTQYTPQYIPDMY